MIELIEKTSYEARDRELKEYLDANQLNEDYEIDLNSLRKYITKEVELAYKAGMLHFNAFDHTMNSISGKTSWAEEKGQKLIQETEVGPLSILPSLY